MKTYQVHGWLNGSDYDANKAADKVIAVTAPNPSEAEDIGDRRLRRSIGKCEVIIAYWEV
jgi:hypothetical protein